VPLERSTPQIAQLPAKDPFPSVEAAYDGSVFPKGGVAFVWVLESELAAGRVGGVSRAGTAQSIDGAATLAGSGQCSWFGTTSPHTSSKDDASPAGAKHSTTSRSPIQDESGKEDRTRRRTTILHT
jgi:hypothetical protein